jgi:NADH-quinone oxidoreductase subunit I
MWIGKEELMSWQPARDAAKPYPARPAPGAGGQQP